MTEKTAERPLELGAEAHLESSRQDTESPIVLVIHENLNEARKLAESGGSVKEVAAAYEKVVREQERMLVRDGLTGLLDYKQSRTREIMQREVDERLADGESVWVCFIDIDDFREINSEYGHMGGDVALQLVARSLERTHLSDDQARNGGDEFLLILKGKGLKKEDVEAVIGRVGALASRASRLNGLGELTLSVGAVELQAGDNLEEIVDGRADTLMYAAKAAGKNRSLLVSLDDRKSPEPIRKQPANQPFVPVPA